MQKISENYQTHVRKLMNNNNKTNLKITEQIMPHSQLIKRLLPPALWKRKKEKKEIGI
jgi:hypothetical protein